MPISGGPEAGLDGAGVFKNNPPRFSDVVGRDKCQSTAGGGFCKKLPQITSFARKVKFLKRVYSRFWVKQEVLVWSDELPNLPGLPTRVLAISSQPHLRFSLVALLVETCWKHPEKRLRKWDRKGFFFPSW